MYKLNLNKDLEIEEMKIKCLFLQAYLNDTNRLMQELVNYSNKIVKYMED